MSEGGFNSDGGSCGLGGLDVDAEMEMEMGRGREDLDGRISLDVGM